MPSRLRPASAADPDAPRPRRRAPLNSVSTRIILCVFGSTLLTAVIVSWLSVGAIQRDMRSRIGFRAERILASHVGAVEALQSEAAARLATATRVGSPWHRALVEAIERAPEQQDWHWASEALPDRPDGPRLAALPAPPTEVAGQFDRLTLTRGPRPQGESVGCFRARADIVGFDSSVAGHVVGCLDRDALYAALHPGATGERGMRILLADRDGRIQGAAGVRAQPRVGAHLPIQTLLHPGPGRIASYPGGQGERQVGALAPLGSAGWVLVAETEYTRAFAPAIEIAKQIFVVDVCIILLFSVLAYQITQAIMKPIDALSEGARRIAAGQVDYEIPTPDRGDDELGLLVRTFNDMMRKLRTHRVEIERDHMRLAEKNEELQRANEILAQLSITDGLTKLHNHRYFQDHLTREIKRVSRTRAPLSMILIDIDDFKLLNDTHGHAAGDDVLVSLAGIMNDSARESDLIARYGGEEFVILMPNTDLAGAVHLAEKIRMAVESTRLIVGDNMKPINVTISLGVALFHGNRREFFAEADKALYQAKAAGKNCVIIAGSEPGDAA